MEERIDLTNLKNNKIERIHHLNRYKLQNQFVYGDILDIACGIGYGSSILVKNKKIKSYTGADISPDAIKIAHQTFSNYKTSFVQADINQTPFKKQQFDCVICNETIEHLPQPTLAIQEISRLVKDHGIFTGTVPSKYYDKFFEQKWGVKNQYHKTQFTRKSLTALLKNHFKFVSVFSCTEDIVTRLHRLNPKNSQTKTTKLEANKMPIP